MATPRVHELFAQVMSWRFVPDTSHECEDKNLLTSTLGKTLGKFTKFQVTDCGSKMKWSNSCFKLSKKCLVIF